VWWFAFGPEYKWRNNKTSPLECKRTSIHFSTRFINSYQRKNKLECTTSTRDRLWEELLAKVKADEGKQELNLIDTIKLKSSFKIKMDMIEKKDEIDTQRKLKQRILKMKPE
jgi:hypothetical protein